MLFSLPRALRYLLHGLVAVSVLSACKKDKDQEPGAGTWHAGWAELPTPPKKRFDGGLLGLRDGRLLAVGGKPEKGSSVRVDGTDFYNPATKTWTSISGGYSGTGYMFEATNGDVFAYGGSLSNGNGTSQFISRLPQGSTSWASLGQIGGFGSGSGVWSGTEISGNRAVFCGSNHLAVWTGTSLELATNVFNEDYFYGATLNTLGLNTPDERLAITGGFDYQRLVSLYGTFVFTVPPPGDLLFGNSPQRGSGGSFNSEVLVLDENTLFGVGGESISMGARNNGVQPYESNTATRTSIARDSLLNPAPNNGTIALYTAVALLRRADGKLYCLDPRRQNIGLYDPATHRWQQFSYTGPSFVQAYQVATLGNALVINDDGVLYTRTF